MVLKFAFKEQLEHKFREVAMKKYGYNKGALTKAGEKAVQNWLNTETSKLPRIKDPVKALRGLLSELKGKYTSVQLQHEALELWGK